MRRRLHILVLLCLIAGSDTTSAECECLWEGAFVDVQSNTSLVVSGRVIERKGNSIDLKIDRPLRGNESLPEIRIWLQTADYCRPDAADFPIDSQWVMALNEITEVVAGGFNPHTPNVSYGRVGDYQLSSCGGYWLRQTENLVSGNLIDAPRWVRDPNMTPVLLDLIDQYVKGTLDKALLLEASKENPVARELMLDTRAFLREQN